MVTVGSVGYHSPYDFLLQDARDGGRVSLGLTLYKGDEGDEPAWEERRVPPLPARRSQGELQFTQRDPTYDLVFSQSDWSDGALQPYYTSLDPQRYSRAHNMDMRWQGVASLGPNVSQVVDVAATGVGNEWVGSAIIQRDNDDELYAASGRVVFALNRLSGAWEADFTHASATATDIIELNGTVFVAFGGDHEYYYKESGGAWTEASIAGADATNQYNEAIRFTKARNNSGAWVLWKSIGTNKIQWNADPTTDVWAPTSPFTVGDSSRTITNMYAMRDTFVIGKTDGLWIWNPADVDFNNVTSEWDNDVSPENGRVGRQWHRDLFITAAQQGLFRYSFDVLEDLSYAISIPRLPEVGGRVTAMGTTTRDLLVALEQAKPDTDDTKRVQIARLRLSGDNSRWQLHIMSETDLAVINTILIDGGVTVWALGVKRDGSLGVIHWDEPQRDVAAFADTTADNASDGWFETSVWHGGVPDTFKACLAMTIWGENIDRNHPIHLSMGVDGAPGDDLEVGVFDVPERVQTIFFENMPDHLTKAIGRFFQFRFTCESSDDSPPHLYAFELHSQAFFEPIRVWTVRAIIGGLLNTGVPHELSKAEIEIAFRALERQVFPPIFTDALGDGRSGPEADSGKLVRIVDYQRNPIESSGGGQEVWTITLQEASPAT